MRKPKIAKVAGRRRVVLRGTRRQWARYRNVALLSLIGLWGCSASHYERCLNAEKTKLANAWSAGVESADQIETALVDSKRTTEVSGFPAAKVVAARWLVEKLQREPLGPFDRDSDRYFDANPYPDPCDDGCADDYWERFESHGPPSAYPELWNTYQQVWDTFRELDKGKIHTQAYNQAVADFADPDYVDKYGIPLEQEIDMYAHAYGDIFSAADGAVNALNVHQGELAAEICNSRGLYE